MTTPPDSGSPDPLTARVEALELVAAKMELAMQCVHHGAYADCSLCHGGESRAAAQQTPAPKPVVSEAPAGQARGTVSPRAAETSGPRKGAAPVPQPEPASCHDCDIDLGFYGDPRRLYRCEDEDACRARQAPATAPSVPATPAPIGRAPSDIGPEMLALHMREVAERSAIVRYLRKRARKQSQLVGHGRTEQALLAYADLIERGAHLPAPISPPAAPSPEPVCLGKHGRSFVTGPGFVSATPCPACGHTCARGVPCEHCGGTGRQIDDPFCAYCDGTGRVAAPAPTETSEPTGGETP